jgi:hypothetical protein
MAKSKREEKRGKKEKSFLAQAVYSKTFKIMFPPQNKSLAVNHCLLR